MLVWVLVERDAQAHALGLLNLAERARRAAMRSNPDIPKRRCITKKHTKWFILNQEVRAPNIEP